MSRAQSGTRRKWGAAEIYALEEVDAHVAALEEVGVNVLPCVVDKPDLRGTPRKPVRHLDVELDKFEAVYPGIWGDDVGVKLRIIIAVVVEGEILALPFRFLLELSLLPVHYSIPWWW